MAGQERREMRRHADRAHAGTAAAVRDAEGLVQVQVRDVAAELARRARGRPSRSCWRRRRTPGRRARCTISQISRDARLEHAVRRRIGDHDRREVGRRAAAPSPRRSARSTLPSSSQATTTTCMPAICAEAGLVPCAELGIRQTLRCALAAARVIGADDEQARRIRPASRRWAAARRPRSRWPAHSIARGRSISSR